MSQAEHQLREYFDAGVERIAAQDVLARAAVEGRTQESAAARPRRGPAWAAAAAFALTLTIFGVAFGALELVRHYADDAATGGAVPVPGAGQGLALWPVVALATAAIAALLTLIRHPLRTQERDEDERKVKPMETMERATINEAQPAALKKRNRWLIAAVAILGFALVGLVLWMVLATRPTSPTTAPTEVAELMDDYVAAWNAYDVEALSGMVTTGYRVHSDSNFDHDMASIESTLMAQLEASDWHNTYEGPWYAVGGTGTWYVSHEGTTIESTLYADGDGVENSVLRVRELGGKLLVDDHFLYGSETNGLP